MRIMHEPGSKLTEVRNVIIALLVAEKTTVGIDIVQLERLYTDNECARIPYRALGYSSLASFIRDIPNVELLSKHGSFIVRFTGQECTKHLSELVANQKPASKSRRNRSASRYIAPHYIARSRSSMLHHTNEITNAILGIVQDNPQGLSNDELLKIYLRSHPHCQFNGQNIAYHLSALASKVIMKNNMIYPVKNSYNSRNPIPRSSLRLSRHDNYGNQTNNSHVKDGIIPDNYRVVPDSTSDDLDSFDYVTSDVPVQENYNRPSTTQDCSKREVPNAVDDTVKKNCEINEKKENLPIESKTENKSESKKTFDENDFIFSRNQEYVATLLNKRTQFRLEKLIQNNPDGIWCIDLPKKYKEEYKISLDWENIGFQRIGDFAAYLPHIFHMVGPFPNGDFRLYDAKAPVPEQSENKVVQRRETLASLHKVYNTDDEDIEAVPTTIPISLSNQLVPDDVMSNGESVGQISVTTFTVYKDIADKKSLVVVRIVEAFHPSFFWIQIEKKQQKFKDMMDELHLFYEEQKAKYSVSIIMLERGLNIACKFHNKWHRGIIKSVNHKCQALVFFYDYGTVKTYPPEEIFFLHRRFSVLPAQAIPCGLYNVKPFEGDQWPINVTDRFIKLVYDRPLWAAIGRINVESNTMLVSLIDVSQEKHDFHISNWMIDKKMAIPGHMDVDDPMDLSSYVEDYDEIYPVTTESEIQQNSSTSSNGVLKLPPDISTIAVENLCSALSILEKKRNIVITTMDSIDYLSNTMQKMILRHSEMISKMHGAINSELLTQLSETLAKMIMDLIHSVLTNTQTKTGDNSDDVKLPLENQQDDVQSNSLTTNSNYECQDEKSNNSQSGDNLTNDINPVNSVQNNQAINNLTEKLAIEPATNNCETVEKTNDINSIPMNSTVPEKYSTSPEINEIMKTANHECQDGKLDIAQSTDNSTNEMNAVDSVQNNQCNNNSVEKLANEAETNHCETPLKTNGINSIPVKSNEMIKSTVEQSEDLSLIENNTDDREKEMNRLKETNENHRSIYTIYNFLDDLTSLNTEESNIEKQFVFSWKELKDSNPFKEDILYNQSKKGLTTPPPLPPRQNIPNQNNNTSLDNFNTEKNDLIDFHIPHEKWQRNYSNSIQK